MKNHQSILLIPVLLSAFFLTACGAGIKVSEGPSEQEDALVNESDQVIEQPAPEAPAPEAPAPEAPAPEAPAPEAPAPEAPAPETPAPPIQGGLDLSYNTTSALGTNTSPINDWGTGIPFINIFKTARHFSELTWLTSANVSYDSQGWPSDLHGGQAGVLMLTDFEEGMLPSGNYTVLYDGEGEIEYNHKARLVSHQPGRDIVDVTVGGDGFFGLTIVETNVNNPLRNIRVLIPGGVCQSDITRRVDSASSCSNNDYLSFEDNHESLMFNPDYLNFMKDFKVVRFMDMMGTNNSKVREWSDWIKYDDAVWTSAKGRTTGQNRTGVPVEVMVKLANMINANPWFTLPHQSSDAFNHQFSSYVRDNLKPGLVVHIEYSNETWNSQFDQSGYMYDKGEQAGLDPDRFQAGRYYYAKRSVELFRVWENEFGGTQRLKRIIAGQSVNTWLSNVYLGYGNTAQYTDAFAIAPYFGGSINNIASIRSTDEVFSAIEATYGQVTQSISEQFDVASQYGIELVAYEGGQHVVAYGTSGDNDGPNPSLYAANRDPRMGALYDRYLRDWKNLGGHTFVQYNAPQRWSRYGSWGLKEYLTQPASETPKYNAVIDFSRNNPIWW